MEKQTTSSDNKSVLLKMERICKGFPGVKALDNVSLTVKAGTVHALMGENGAGKSTLMKCLFGVYNKDSGNIYLEGKEVDFKTSKEALENGVAMVHQELNQALKRNVMDNMWLGRFPKISKWCPLTSEKKKYEKSVCGDTCDGNVYGFYINGCCKFRSEFGTKFRGKYGCGGSCGRIKCGGIVRWFSSRGSDS